MLSADNELPEIRGNQPLCHQHTYLSHLFDPPSLVFSLLLIKHEGSDGIIPC